MIITNDHISFAEIKNHFYFSDHSSENLYRQNDGVPIDHFATNFQKKSLDLMDHEKKMLIQNNSKDAQLQILSWTFDKSFLFLTNEKKMSP